MKNRTTQTGLVVAALLLASGLVSSAEEPAAAWSARYRTFLGEAERVRSALASLYGRNWRPTSLTSEIAREVSWLEGEEAGLQWDHSRLVASARSLAEETDLMRRKSRLLQIDGESLDREMKPLDAEEASLREQLEAFNRRAAIHNANPPPSDDEAATAAYNQEAEAGNAEARRLRSELQRVAAAKARIEERRQALFTRAAELASRDRYLERSRQVFDADASRFVGRCEEAICRARALAVIGGSKPADLARGFRRLYEPKPNALVAVLQSVGESAALSVLAKLAVRGTGPVGAAITAREFLAPHVGRAEEDVQDRLLLVGDYAAALKRLKQQGRLDEKDPDYQALRQMLERTGKQMPRNGVEFLAQSTKLSDLLQDGLATLAKGYVLKKVLPDTGQLAAPLARAEKASIGRQSERLVTAFELGVKETAYEKLGDQTWDAVRERTMKEWSEAGRRTAGPKGGSR